MDSLGDRIRIIRKKLGLTMKEFGEMFNPPADKSNVSRWEKNLAIPNNERLKNIAELGNTTVAYLIRPANGEVSIEIAVEVAKDIFYKNLSSKEKLRNEIQKALEYYNNDSLDLILEQEVSRYLSNPEVVKNGNLRTLSNLQHFEVFLITSLSNRYKKEVPSNQHLIESIYKEIPKDPVDYGDFQSPMITAMPLARVLEENSELISDNEKVDLKELASNGATLFFSEYEGSVDPELKEEITTLLQETRQKLGLLKDKYPDRTSKVEQDTKIFVDNKNWWKRGQTEVSDTLKLSESTKKEIIRLGKTLLNQEFDK